MRVVSAACTTGAPGWGGVVNTGGAGATVTTGNGGASADLEGASQSGSGSQGAGRFPHRPRSGAAGASSTGGAVRALSCLSNGCAARASALPGKTGGAKRMRAARTVCASTVRASASSSVAGPGGAARKPGRCSGGRTIGGMAVGSRRRATWVSSCASRPRPSAVSSPLPGASATSSPMVTASARYAAARRPASSPRAMRTVAGSTPTAARRKRRFDSDSGGADGAGLAGSRAPPGAGDRTAAPTGGAKRVARAGDAAIPG